MGAVCLLWQSWQFLFLFSPWLAVQFRQSIPVVHVVGCPQIYNGYSVSGTLSAYSLVRASGAVSVTLCPGQSDSLLSLLGCSSTDLLAQAGAPSITVSCCEALPSLPLISRCHSVRDPSVSSCHSTFLTAQVFFPGCTIICPVSWVVPLDDTPYPRPR